MKTKLSTAVILTLLALMPGAVLPVFAAQDVGKIVALRGTATIERGSAKLNGRVNTGIQGTDAVKTGAGSRAKLLFIDDSVLTLSADSRLVVKEFIYAKGKEGKSVFNLLDGKMRSVVGKTRFEVRTPTAVAAARGTVIYFDVGTFNNQSFSRIICLEGNVEVRSVTPSVAGAVTLTPGTMVIVRAGEPVPLPVVVPPGQLGTLSSGDNANGGSNEGSPGGGGNNAPPTDNTGIDQRPILPSKARITIPIPR
jgi:hypothetical protein